MTTEEETVQPVATHRVWVGTECEIHGPEVMGYLMFTDGDRAAKVAELISEEVEYTAVATNDMEFVPDWYDDSSMPPMSVQMLDLSSLFGGLFGGGAVEDADEGGIMPGRRDVGFVEGTVLDELTKYFENDANIVDAEVVEESDQNVG
jgi:hypothetical protein